MQGCGSLTQRGERLRGGTQRILVGCQFNDACETQFPLEFLNRLPRNIGI